MMCRSFQNLQNEKKKRLTRIRNQSSKSTQLPRIPYNCIIDIYDVDYLYLHVRCHAPVMRMSRSTMSCIVGTVDGCSYDGQLKSTICDTCRPCHLKSEHTEASFSPNLTYSYQISRLGSFCVHDDDNNEMTDYFTPCTCAQGNNGFQAQDQLHCTCFKQHQPCKFLSESYEEDCHLHGHKFDAEGSMQASVYQRSLTENKLVTSLGSNQ